MVTDRIDHYRLTKKIIEKELLQMFPTTTSAALEIKEGADAFTFKVPTKLTEAQKAQILKKRLKDRRQDNW